MTSEKTLLLVSSEKENVMVERAETKVLLIDF